MAVVSLWPRVGRPFHSFLALGCGGCALTFAGIMFLCIWFSQLYILYFNKRPLPWPKYSIMVLLSFCAPVRWENGDLLLFPPAQSLNLTFTGFFIVLSPSLLLLRKHYTFLPNQIPRLWEITRGTGASLVFAGKTAFPLICGLEIFGFPVSDFLLQLL